MNTPNLSFAAMDRGLHYSPHRLEQTIDDAAARDLATPEYSAAEVLFSVYAAEFVEVEITLPE